jgi:hypothetical protein
MAIERGNGGVAHGLDLLDPRLRALLEELEDVADRHGRELSRLGFVGSVEITFSPHRYRSTRLSLFLKPYARQRQVQKQVR